MSILIPGMEMPKNCLECPLCWEDEEGMNCCFTNVVCLNIGRQAACPLIELTPHGRLIDADALKVYQMEENVRADGEPNEYEYDAGLIDGLHMAAKAVSVAPTVIPAEEE